MREICLVCWGKSDRKSLWKCPKPARYRPPRRRNTLCRQTRRRRLLECGASFSVDPTVRTSPMTSIWCVSPHRQPFTASIARTGATRPTRRFVVIPTYREVIRKSIREAVRTSVSGDNDAADHAHQLVAVDGANDGVLARAGNHDAPLFAFAQDGGFKQRRLGADAASARLHDVVIDGIVVDNHNPRPDRHFQITRVEAQVANVDVHRRPLALL